MDGCVLCGITARENRATGPGGQTGMWRTAYVEIDKGRQLKCYVPPELAIHDGDFCIVETDNVQDFGKVVDLQENESGSVDGGKLPRVLRCATLQDQAKATENALMGKMAMETCQAKAEKYEMKVRLIRVRYSFDRLVLTVLFQAEDRVDYREMVKELAGELVTRIEMKQIGVRDVAGMVGGLGPCGRRLCCASWLRSFESVNVKMAKMQRLSLNPGAISGMCGRLKCCLRYEYDSYEELARGLPREGLRVQCPDGKGCVIDRDILAQRVKVRLNDDRVLEYDVNQVRRTWIGKGKNRRSGDEDPGA